MGLTAEMAGKSPNSTQVSIMGKKHRTKWGHVPARHGLITPEGVHLQKWTTLMGQDRVSHLQCGLWQYFMENMMFRTMR